MPYVLFHSLVALSGLFEQAFRKHSLEKNKTVFQYKMSLTLMVPRVSLETCLRTNPLRPKVMRPNMTAMIELRTAENILPFRRASVFFSDDVMTTAV